MDCKLRNWFRKNGVYMLGASKGVWLLFVAVIEVGNKGDIEIIYFLVIFLYVFCFSIVSIRI